MRINITFEGIMVALTFSMVAAYASGSTNTQVTKELTNSALLFILAVVILAVNLGTKD